MSTLGGTCQGEKCSDIWSAARPEGDKGANTRFYQYMQQNHPGVPANPPAEPCVPVP
jgi:hypothetical protein